MARYAVAWVGPVAAYQVAGANVPGAPAVYINCTGDGHPDCAAQGAAAAAANGSIPQGLLNRAGVPDGQLIIGSFSAGHEITKPALMAPSDRALVKAVMLADSTYSSWANQATRTVTPPEGYVRYTLDVVQNPTKMLVATASGFRTGTYPSGSETLAALKDEIEKRSCRQFETEPGLPGVSTPATVSRLGNVWLADFGVAVPHASHATVLAPQIWQGLLNPWLDGTVPSSEPMFDACALPGPAAGSVAPQTKGLSTGAIVALAALGAAAGYASYRAFR